MEIRIKNLRARGIIGIYDWEKDHPQDVIINVSMIFDGTLAAQTDKIEDTVDYKRVKKRILDIVEHQHFGLIEKMATAVMDMIMEDSKVEKATVEIDKPFALRFADSVSVSHTVER
ncbi:dihydroneopterin aldolase [bacterium]|nr:dihydroneopterin aldolase [bacterium]